MFKQALDHPWMKEGIDSDGPGNSSSEFNQPLPSSMTEVTTLTPPQQVQSSNPPLPPMSKKFHPVFWSPRTNMSATLTGEIIPHSVQHNWVESNLLSHQIQLSADLSQNKSRIEDLNFSNQTTHQSNSPLIDEIDEFSSDEDKPIKSDFSHKPTGLFHIIFAIDHA